MPLRWYAAETKAGQGRIALDNLSRQGFAPYEPAVADEPLFPGYLLLAFDIGEPGWRAINSTVGVFKLLPLHLEIPAPLPVGYVEELQRKIAAGMLTPHSAADISMAYLPGDVVAVTSGAFGGLNGELVRRHKGSLVLLMALLGPQTEVTVPAHQIAPPIDAPSTAPTARWLRRSKTRRCGHF